MYKKKPNARNSKGKRNFGGKQRIDRKVNSGHNVFDEERISDRNDWRWYATNEQLVKDAASFPYGYALGSRVNLGPYGADANKGSLPGIMTMLFAPSVGWSDNPNSPINVASRAIYTDIRKTNSGGVNYDPSDMMIYLTAMDSCYTILEFMKRAYGVMQLYSPVNRYLPRALVTAMGFDFDSLASHMADFRAAINIYAQKLKSLVIPNSMSYMAKHQWLVQGIYQDHNTDKSQIYMFVPHMLYKFGFDSDGAGMLQSKRWIASDDYNTTYDEAIAFMNDLLDPILANQDFTIMSGDILKWRGSNGIVVPTGITDTFQVFPVYDETVLDQINNATPLGIPSWTGSSGEWVPTDASELYEVRQDATKSYLVSTPSFRHYFVAISGENPGRNALLANRIINFMHEHVAPEETMEATRLTNVAHGYTTDTNNRDWFKFQTIGSEVLTSCVIWWYAYPNSGVGDWQLYHDNILSTSEVLDVDVYHTLMSQGNLNHVGAQIRDVLRRIQRLETFDRHPMIAFSGHVQDKSDVLDPYFSPFSGFMNDINYYTILNEQDLGQMAEVALLSEFNVRIER